jgi:hypothetical protein
MISYYFIKNNKNIKSILDPLKKFKILKMSFSYKDFCGLFFGKNRFKKSCSVQKKFQK